MSNSSNITGILARLINGTTESPTPSTSAANLNPVSFTTAYANSRSQTENNRTTPSINATKKAIVLRYINEEPIADSTAEYGTNWLSTILVNYGVSEATTDVISSSGITSYPKYRVWIIPDNLSIEGIVPIMREGRITNLDRFPICSVKDSSMTTELVKGALIRIDFENRVIKSDAYVTNIINNGAEFGRAVFTELEGIISPIVACIPCVDNSPSVSHPSGDTIGTGANNFNSGQVIRINNDAIYPYVEGMSDVELVIFYHGIEPTKSVQERQNTILGILEQKKDTISNKLFLIPYGHDRNYQDVQNTISELQSDRNVNITAKKLGFWSGGSLGGKTALEQEIFAKVEIADPTPQNGSIPTNILTSGSL